METEKTCETKKTCCKGDVCPCCTCCICVCTKDLAKILTPQAKKLLIQALQ